MAAKPIRQATFATKPAFNASYERFFKRNPSIRETFAAFLAAKRERPPVALSRGMRDHALNGLLDGFKECHLAADACLIYTDKADVVTLIEIVDHDQMQGGKAKALAKRIASDRP